MDVHLEDGTVLRRALVWPVADREQRAHVEAPGSAGETLCHSGIKSYKVPPDAKPCRWCEEKLAKLEVASDG